MYSEHFMYLQTLHLMTCRYYITLNKYLNNQPWSNKIPNHIKTYSPLWYPIVLNLPIRRLPEGKFNKTKHELKSDLNVISVEI